LGYGGVAEEGAGSEGGVGHRLMPIGLLLRDSKDDRRRLKGFRGRDNCF
jgi:hypothetical protein